MTGFHDWLLSETTIYDVAKVLLPDPNPDINTWLVSADELQDMGHPELAGYIWSRSGFWQDMPDNGWTKKWGNASDRYWRHWPFDINPGMRDGSYSILPSDKRMPVFKLGFENTKSVATEGFPAWYADTVNGEVRQFTIRERVMRPRRWASVDDKVYGIYRPESKRPLFSVDMREWKTRSGVTWDAFHSLVLNCQPLRYPPTPLDQLPEKLVEYLIHIAIGWKIRTHAYRNANGGQGAIPYDMTSYQKWERDSDDWPPNPYVRDEY